MRPSDRVETLDFPDRLRAAFRADAPGIGFVYDLSFRLLGVTLFRLGEMHVEAVTGHLGDDPAKTRACLLDCRMKPPAAVDSRAVLRDRFVLLADVAARKTMVFAQISDESYRPLIGRTRRKLKFGLHDYRGAEPYTFRTNLVTGASSASVGDRPGRERPGEAVMELLNLLADIQSGRRPDVDAATSPRVFAHVDGEIRPFVVKTTRDDPPGEYPRETIDALRADITAAPEAETHRGRLVAWVSPFPDVARAAHLPSLAASAHPSPLPLVVLAADVELAVGTVRAVLKKIAGTPESGPLKAGG
ncbi:MAG: hypothetical protein KJ579_00870 [Verrucomicrobia bacterium]|nr:hypothetical protein [Verrucomicrobiota bacterium]